ncbi:MAG: Mur ligase family protein [bacterium]
MTIQPPLSFPKIIHFLEANIATGGQLFPGKAGLKRMQLLMANLDNPQETYQTIHIAGTSGKGSTATIISSLLMANGYHTGLTISPHLWEIRERIQLNNQFISEKEFIKIFQKITPAINKTAQGPFGHPSYFEMLLAMAFQYFSDQKVDYAIIETGLGGLLDGTNVIKNKNKISVITKIGKDHTQILGNTLAKITKHKAGIINSASQVFTLKQNPTVNQVLIHSAKIFHAKIQFIDPSNINKINIQNDLSSFQLKQPILEISDITTNMVGKHQAENILLALSVLDYLKSRDHLNLNSRIILKQLRQIHFPGRFEIQTTSNGKIICDGAHNPQKMSALVRTLQNYSKEQYHFLVAIKNGKDYQKILLKIFPLAKSIIFTEFSLGQENNHGSWSATKLVEFCQKSNYKNCIAIQNQALALKELQAKSGLKVITGSLYLIGAITRILLL